MVIQQTNKTDYKKDLKGWMKTIGPFTFFMLISMISCKFVFIKASNNKTTQHNKTVLFYKFYSPTNFLLTFLLFFSFLMLFLLLVHDILFHSIPSSSYSSPIQLCSPSSLFFVLKTNIQRFAENCILFMY